MPMHDYKCSNKKCLHEFEVWYSSHSTRDEQEPNERCPKCNGKRKKKLVSKGTGFVLNGNGWYKKHYG